MLFLCPFFISCFVYHVTYACSILLVNNRCAALIKGRGKVQDRCKSRNVLKQRSANTAAFRGSCGIFSSKRITKQASRFSEDQRKTSQVRFGVKERARDLGHFPASCAGRARARMGGHQVQRRLWAEEASDSSASSTRFSYEDEQSTSSEGIILSYYEKLVSPAHMLLLNYGL